MNTELQLNHIILLLDKAAPSFCYYDNESSQSELMPLETVRECIEFAQIHSLGLHVIYGKNPLPNDYKELLEKTSHIRIRPYCRGEKYSENDIIVMDTACDLDYSIGSSIVHVILRLPITDISNLYSFIEKNHPGFKRLSVVFKGIEQADERVLNEFRLSLGKLRPLIFQLLRKQDPVEIGFVTDRILLNTMNNCNAGHTHVTIAPNGEFYICPGFYYLHAKPIGTCKDGIQIVNGQLYRFDHALVCQKCDCFQCKRCVYLNQLTTLEVNIPSHAQCVVSHHERNLSGMLLEKLHKQGDFINLPAIPPLFGLDPIELLEN